jgi:tartrate dehydratase alpha subunit/fumarate hydratase class I-like protein
MQISALECKEFLQNRKETRMEKMACALCHDTGIQNIMINERKIKMECNGKGFKITSIIEKILKKDRMRI